MIAALKSHPQKILSKIALLTLFYGCEDRYKGDFCCLNIM